MSELKEYTLGSGHLHIEEFTELPKNWDPFFASTDNLLGRIKGGAAIEYTTDKYEDQDDLGYVVIEEITKEKVVLKSGVMTWNGSTLEKICSTARTTVADDGTIITKIGGLGNQKNTRWVIGFEHKNKDLRVIIVGRNNEGFTFDFKQDSATVIDVQFRAEASDEEGTLIILQDLRKRPVLSSLSVGGLALTPAFSPFVTEYTAKASGESDKITAGVKNSSHTVAIKNGETAVENGKAAAWSSGENTVTVVVSDGGGHEIKYTVNVTRSAA